MNTTSSNFEFNTLIENMIKLNELVNYQQIDKINNDQILLKYLNRTNSNTSCISSSSGLDSGYLSSNDSINNLSRVENRTITYGYFGKAKSSTFTCSNSNQSNQFTDDSCSTIYKQLINENNRSFIDHVNHGDDVGFVLSKTIQNDDYDENIYYMAIADGVSANRLRGYDAKLFPNALLHSCASYIANNHSTLIQDECVDEEFLKNNSFLCLNESNNEEKDDKDEQDENEVDEEEEEIFNEEYNEQFDSELENDINEIADNICNNNGSYTIENNNNNNNENSDVLSFSKDYLNCFNHNNDCKYLYKTLQSAHNDVNDQQVYGSSTACLLSLKFLTSRKNSSNDDEFNYNFNSNLALLSTCNLGDSGYMIIRNKQVIFKSQTQTHRFNAPYQLGCTPPELLDHDLYRDRPEDSICHTHEIKLGDFILLSSDGLFDNLYEDEIAMIIDNHIQSSILKVNENEQISSTKTVLNSNQITNNLLNEACEILVEKASKAGIKRDDMLIILAYVN